MSWQLIDTVIIRMSWQLIDTVRISLSVIAAKLRFFGASLRLSTSFQKNAEPLLRKQQFDSRNSRRSFFDWSRNLSIPIIIASAQ
jgi:hypothetical protein